MPNRILHSEASMGWGGQEIRIFTELLAMRERGHQVYLAAPAGAELFRKASAEGIETISFSPARSAYPGSIVKLSRWIRKIRIQVVNMHSSRDGYIAGLAARLAGVPCIIRTRHIDVDYPNPFVSRIGFRWIPHHVITTSERICHRLSEDLHLPDAFTTSIPTGIDLTKYSPEVPAIDPAPERKERKDRKPNAKMIGMVAVLRSWKGHRDFISAAKALRSKGSNAHFIIAGAGPMERRIREWIVADQLEDDITLTGHVDHIPGLLKALDALVLPSTAHEGIPQILLQAQACGIPVVGTRVGGIPEVIEDGHTGLLIDPGEPDRLCEALEKLLNDPELSARLATRALEHARQHYGIELMCQRTEKCYERVLEKNAG